MKYLSSISSDNCDVTFVDGTFKGNLNLSRGSNGLATDYYERVISEGGTVESLYSVADAFEDHGNLFAVGSVFANGIYSTSNGYVGGRLGIGTSNPLYKLDVDGSVRFTGDLTVDTNTLYVDSTNNRVGIGTTSPYFYPNYKHITIDGASGSGYMLRVNGSNKYEHYVDSGGALFYLIDNDPLKFYTNSTERLRIDGSGNVGIGTTSPSNQLHIVSASNNASALIIQDDARRLQLGRDMIEARSVDGTTVQNLYIQPNGNVGIATSSGNVGIGTTNPIAKLDVIGGGIHTNGTIHIETGGPTLVLQDSTDDDDHNITFKNNAGTNIYNIDTSGDTFNIRSYYARPVTILTNNSERLRIDGSGNVGIGTTSPNALLDVNKSAIGEYAYFGSGSTRQLRLSSYNTASDHAGHKINASSINGEIILAIAGTDAVTVKNDQTIQLNAYGAGYLKTDASGNITVDTDTIEDTLQSVTDRGATTTNAITTSTHTISNGYLILSGASSSVNPEIDFTDDSGFGVAGYKLRYGNGDGWTFYDSYWASGGGHRFRTRIASSTIEALTITHTGNVGIGTTNPGSKLQVEGDIALAANGVIGQGSIYGNSGNASFSTLKLYDSSTGDTVLNNQSYDIELNTGGSTKFIVKNSGNVGIGTTSPLGKLHVENSSVRSTVNGGADNIVIEENGYSGITILSSNANAGQIHFGDQNAENIGMIQYFHSDNSMRFTANAAERMRITSAGNVGIGTTSPSAKLDVSHTIRTTGKNTPGSGKGLEIRYDTIADKGTILSYDRDSSGYKPILIEGSTIVLREAATDVLTVEGGNVGIGTSSPSQDLTLYRSSGDTNFLISSNNGASQIFFGDTESDNVGKIDYDHSDNSLNFVANAAERMRITSAGNVGIGTTSPDRQLQVHASDSGTSTAKFTNSTTGEDGDTGFFVGINGNEEPIVYGYNATDMRFGTNGTERMRITSAGNVGIKTNSPASDLHVNSSNNVGIILQHATRPTIALTDGTNYGYIGLEGGGNIITGTTDNDLSIRSPRNIVFGGNSIARVTIENTGNVGIGTTSPAGQLSVYTSVYNRFDVSYPGTYITKLTIGGGAFIQQDAGNEVLTIDQGYGGGDIAFNAGGSVQRMIIKDNGNVGIGTASPTQKLHVVGGQVRLDSNAGGFYQYNTSGGFRSAFYDNGTVTSIFGDGDGNNPAISINSGNVGIGTTSPSGKLHIKPDANSGYVFTGTSTSGYTATFNIDDTGLDIGHDSSIRALNLKTNSADRLTITGGGNVGIGTTSPAQKLDVTDGKLQFTNTTSGRNSTIGMDDNYNFYIKNTALGNLYLGNGTTTYVNGSLNVDSGVLYVNHTTNNVGIGTTSPSATLTVTGNQLFDGTGINLKRTGVLSGRTWNLGVDSNGLSVYDINSSSYRLTIDETGNVGIGTSSPGAKLAVEVAGTADVIKFTRDAGVNGEMTFDFTSANSNFHSNQGGFTFSGSSSSYGVNFTASGNVLIGTTTDNGYKLNVNGEAQLGYINFEYNSNYAGVRWKDSSYNLQWKLGNDGPSGNWLYLYDYGMSASAFTFKPNGDMLFTPGGNVGIGTNSPVQKLQVDGSIYSNGGEIFVNGNKGLTAVGNLIFKGYNGSNYFEGMRLTSSGNVLIGTTTDSGYKLDVAGSFQSLNQAVFKSYIDVNSTIFHRQNIRVLNKLGNNWVTWATRDTSGAESVINLSNIGTLTTTSNVGIGTATPSYPLHVKSTESALIQIEGTTATNYTAIRYLGTGRTWSQGVGNDSETLLGLADKFYLYDSTAAATRLVVDTSGNVGIGTTSPAEKLQIEGNIKLPSTSGNGLFFVSGSAPSGLSWYSQPGTSDGPQLISYGSAHVIIDSDNNDADTRFFTIRKNGTNYANSTELLRVTESGNVGIGTSSPDYELDTSGIIRATEGYTSATGTYTGGGTYTNQWQKMFTAPYSTFSYQGFKIVVKLIGDTANVSCNAEIHVTWKFQSNNGRINVNIINYGELQLEASNFEVYRDGTNGVITFYHRINRNYTSPEYTIIGASDLSWYNTVVGASLSGETNDAWTEKNILNGFTSNIAGNFGIGTTSPSQALEVNGNIKMSGTTYDGYFGATYASWGGSLNYPTIFGGDVNRWVMHVNPHISYTQNGVNGFTGSMTGATLRFASDTSASNYWDAGVGTNGVGTDKFSIGRNQAPRMTISNTGNVLIGTTTDSGYKLDVSGINTVARLKSSSSYVDMIMVNSSNTGFLNLDATGMRFYVGGGSGGDLKMSITNGGNVGIGTTSPSVKLDVQGVGGSAVGYTDVIANFKRTQANENSYIAIDNTTAGYDSGIRFAEAGTTKWTLLSYRSSNPDGFAFYNHTASNIPFFIGDSGNVGIGTTNPTTKLHLYVDSANNDTFQIYNSTIRTHLLGSESSNGVVYLRNSSNVNTVRLNSNGASYFNGGNVGIGTTSPDARLEVSAAGTTSQEIAHFGNSNGVGKIKMQLDGVGSSKQVMLDASNNEDIVLSTQGDSYINSGNVGIGTTNPTTKLYVDAGESTFNRGNSDGAIARFRGKNAEQAVIGTLTSWFDSNVGIGTTTPSYPLEVSSSAAANVYGVVDATNANATAAWVAFNDQNDNVVYRIFGSGNTGVQMGQSLGRSSSLMYNGGGQFLVGTYSNSNYIMGTNNTERMRLTTGGNLLIATTTDNGEKLQVAGNAKVSGDIEATGDFYQNGVQGWSGTISINANPPVTITVQGGIITNVT